MPTPKKPSDEVLEYIRNFFRYDPETGILERFHKLDCQWHIVRLTRSYDAVRDKHRNPCVLVRTDSVQHGLQVANVCWYLHHGIWPAKEIDHMNLDPLDNRMVNLKLATRAMQGINQRGNKTLLPGVYLTKGRKNPYRVKIKTGNKSIHIGQFPTEIAAHEAYRAKYKEIYGEELDFPYLEWHAPQVIELDPSE